MNVPRNDTSLNKNPALLRLMGRGSPYFIKTPWWLKQMFPHRLWNNERDKKNIYLTFDDGPHPVATNFVLDELKKYNAKASFFCIGKNVTAHQDLYQRIIREGHSVGNHTQSHLNGWSSSTSVYLANVAEAANHIQSGLFRPPYGRIKQEQAKGIPKAMNHKQAMIVMWDVLSGDFDESISGEICLKNVLVKTRPGSIVVFHDSEKAFPRLQYVLPRMLEYFKEKGYLFEAIKQPA